MYFQLAPSMLPTDGTGFGLLPTPAAQEPGKAPEGAVNHGNYFKRPDGSKINSSINLLAQHALLPTPTSWDEKNGGKLEDGRIQRKIQQGWTIELNNLATIGALPTPDNTETQSQTGETSHKLNPQFVLEMMGFPPDWTELPFQNGETKA